MVSKLIRRSHMYLALFLTPWMLMYALSTIAMQHRSWFAGEGEPLEYSVNSTTTYDGDFAPDVDVDQMAEQLLAHMRMDGLFRARRLDDGKLEVVRFNPLQNQRLTLNPADKNLVVETASMRPARALENLHRARGFQTGMAVRTAWAVVVDAVIVAIVFWCFSGLWLWWQLKTTRRIGAICALSGLGVFALFLARI